MTRVSILPGLCLVLCAAADTGVLADVIVEPGVLESIESGPARVIVELRLEDGFAPEGELTASEARAQRDAIAAAQETVLNDLAALDVRILRRPETIPFLALEIRAPALAELCAMPKHVTRILADDTAMTQRSQH